MRKLYYILGNYRHCDHVPDLTWKMQVEYTTYRDADGKYVSADSAEGDCIPERVPDKDVSHLPSGRSIGMIQNL